MPAQSKEPVRMPTKLSSGMIVGPARFGRHYELPRYPESIQGTRNTPI